MEANRAEGSLEVCDGGVRRRAERATAIGSGRWARASAGLSRRSHLSLECRPVCMGQMRFGEEEQGFPLHLPGVLGTCLGTVATVDEVRTPYTVEGA